MKFYKIILNIIFISISSAQFTDVSINIDYSNINENQMFIFDDFENEIKSYFLNNYFFDNPDQIDIDLTLHVIIENINEKGGEKIVSAQILFSNQKDIHLFSKSFDFPYNRSEALYKSEIFHPMASLLDCYAYLYIAYELDTYEYLGGNNFFLKAQNVASDGKNSSYSKNWQSRLKKIKKQKEHDNYRSLRYNFFAAYDIVYYSDPINHKEINTFYKTFYNEIERYEENYGYNKPLTQFLNAYSSEITYIAKKIKFNEIIDYLIIYDEANNHIYQKYYEN